MPTWAPLQQSREPRTKGFSVACALVSCDACLLFLYKFRQRGQHDDACLLVFVLHACFCLCSGLSHALPFPVSVPLPMFNVLPACSPCLALLVLGCQELFFALLCLLMLGLPWILPFPSSRSFLPARAHIVIIDC